MTPNEIAILITRAAKLMDVTPAAIMTSPRKARHPDIIARRLVFYQMHRKGENLKRIGKALGRTSDPARVGIRWMAAREKEFARELAVMDGREG